MLHKYNWTSSKSKVFLLKETSLSPLPLQKVLYVPCTLVEAKITVKITQYLKIMFSQGSNFDGFCKGKFLEVAENLQATERACSDSGRSLKNFDTKASKEAE